MIPRPFTGLPAPPAAAWTSQTIRNRGCALLGGMARQPAVFRVPEIFLPLCFGVWLPGVPVPENHHRNLHGRSTEDYNAFSYICEKHQRQYGANGKIMGYMQQTYKYPSDFDTFIYASQLLRRMPSVTAWSISAATRAAVWVRFTGSSTTAGRWCPGPAWTMRGRLKALHYYARRFSSPSSLSCEEQGMMSVEANMNQGSILSLEKSIPPERGQRDDGEAQVTVKVGCCNPKAETLREAKKTFCACPYKRLAG